MSDSIPWHRLVDTLEEIYLFYHTHGGYPPPASDTVPSISLDEECDKYAVSVAARGPQEITRNDVVQWLRVRALAACCLAQKRARAQDRPPYGPIRNVVLHYMVYEWNNGLREWWSLRVMFPND